MTSTPLLGIPEIDPNQLGKAATHNEGLFALEQALGAILNLDASALTSPYTIPYASGDEPAVTKTAVRFFKANVTGAISGDWTAYMPAGLQKFFVVENSTTGGYNVIFMVSAMTGVTIPPGFTALCFMNGADVELELIGTTGTPTTPYDYTGFFEGSITASETMLSWIVGRSGSYPANYAGSFGAAVNAATAPSTFLITKNGSPAGTAVWTGSSISSFTTPGGAVVSFSPGDIFVVTSPSSPDATLSGLTWCMTGNAT